MSDNNNPVDEGLEFASVLIRHRNGIEHDDATRRLREAVAAAIKTRKPAKVTVAMEIKPVSNVSNAVKITTTVGDKIPEEIESSMWFTDDDGGLHRADPSQRPLWEDPASTDGKSAAAGKD
ncbi:hypothetical protein ORI20_13835 [Mycobacterium sp. CVI_P3]|uniref:Uncharacterized protein n=1 Tax=Mycobacterium pinniadriaticum TaxID=2994102 RepID=A0ABT3SE51_9MYCO|nr:hypothetical protein [Mycobacterium pinniadriaticum]MCX2931360.1 hypothetical protein [Mycobacterium pinniadriaticum]MCX2937784.1 hypothetical protein [Mycobacterium pinniadriaticum]